jgi:hypothetical protein
MRVPPAVFSRLQVLANEPQYRRMDRNEPDLVSLAPDPEVHHPLTALHVFQWEATQLLTADAVIEEGSEDGAVAQPLQW